MQTKSNFKSLLNASLVLFIIACNSSSQKDTDSKDKLADTTVVNAPVPAQDLPNVETQTIKQKCYTNEGLKYKVVITINYISATEVTGSVVSQELESDKKGVAKFTGIIDGDKLTVQFRETAPVVGAASEWTTKPWIIDNTSGKEKIRIVFNSKNYETNKWSDTGYELELAGCK
jgi:hypothetical protein